MTVYYSFDEVPFDANTVLTMGTFDGLHKGHQLVLTTLLRTSESMKARNFVLTFDPHPQIVLKKADKPPVQLLTTIQERLFVFNRMRVDNVLVIPFSHEFAEIPPETFVREYLSKKIGLKHILIGYDHLFGKNREGDETLLDKLGEELQFTVKKTDGLTAGEQMISSTKIRNFLKAGDIRNANAMLGYPYIVMGKVVRGDGRGRKLGIPTANILPTDAHKLLPKSGVYLTSCIIDGVNYYGMANVGRRPTFTDDVHPTIEVHFFGLDKSLYERDLFVSFLQFIREERKFASIDFFFSQIAEDRMTCYEMIEQIGAKIKS